MNKSRQFWSQTGSCYRVMLAACRSNRFVVTVTERVGWQIGSTHTWLPTSHKGAALHVRYRPDLHRSYVRRKEFYDVENKSSVFSGVWHRGQWHRSSIANLREAKFMSVYCGYRNLPKIYLKILDDRNDMNQAPYRGSTNIRSRVTKFSRLG